MVYYFVSKRPFPIIIAAGILVYFGLYYKVQPTHDMARYIAYMGAIQDVSSLGDYLRQLFSHQPISVYGLSGKDWPLSGVTLYLFSKLRNPLWISGFTLGVNFFSRLYPLTKIETSKDEIDAKILFVLTSLVLLALTPPLMVLSGVRWYLAAAIMVSGFTIELLSKSKDIWILVIYLLAGMFHPAFYIVAFLKIIQMNIISFFEARKLTPRKILNLLVFALVIFVGVGLLKDGRLFNQFLYYTESGSGAFSVSKLDLVVDAFISSLIIIGMYNLMKAFNRENFAWITASLSGIVCLVSFGTPFFSRWYALTLTLIILSQFSGYKTLDNKVKNEYLLLLYVQLFCILGLTAVTMIISWKSNFPELTKPLIRILLGGLLNGIFG